MACLRETARALEFDNCGRTFSRHAVRIVDAGGKDLPERCVGEIVFSGPSVAAGYWDRPDLTAETFRPDGLHTGDLGYLADGDLCVTGRMKDIIWRATWASR
jgi:fatty-acyl-CoA synthase